jgi:hypothetical protein
MTAAWRGVVAAARGTVVAAGLVAPAGADPAGADPAETVYTP